MLRKRGQARGAGRAPSWGFLPRLTNVLGWTHCRRDLKPFSRNLRAVFRSPPHRPVFLSFLEWKKQSYHTCKLTYLRNVHLHLTRLATTQRHCAPTDYRAPRALVIFYFPQKDLCAVFSLSLLKSWVSMRSIHKSQLQPSNLISLDSLYRQWREIGFFWR